MILEHHRSIGLQLTYTIEAKTSGSYVIRLGGKVLRSWSDPGVMAGLTRPSKELEMEAVQSAVRAIEGLSACLRRETRTTPKEGSRLTSPVIDDLLGFPRHEPNHGGQSEESEIAPRGHPVGHGAAVAVRAEHVPRLGRYRRQPHAWRCRAGWEAILRSHRARE